MIDDFREYYEATEPGRNTERNPPKQLLVYTVRMTV